MTENKKPDLALQNSLSRGKTVIGIDIGTSSVNVAQAAMYNGKPVIIKVMSENIEIMGDEERKKATTKVLKNILANFNIQNADVVCTVSNQKTIVDYVMMPRMTEAELRSDAIKIEVNNSSRFPIENPVFDFRIIGTVIEKDVEKVNVMVAVVAQSSIDNLLSFFKPSRQDWIYRLKELMLVQDFMGLNLVKIIPTSIALENIIKKSKFRIQETNVILEMGSMISELNIYRNGNLEFSRKINIAGLDFTRSLTSALSTNLGKVELTLQEAEWVKKEFGIPSASEQYLIKDKITANQVISFLRPKLEQLIKEITKSFDFYYDQHRVSKLDRMVLLGGATMLKGLPEFLNFELGLPVGLDNPLENVSFLNKEIWEGVQDKQRLTLAIGAALSDTGGINLLPEPSRNSVKNFYQRLTMGSLGGAFVLASIIFYMFYLVKLNDIKQESVKSKSEHQSLMPAIKDIKNKLLIQKIANQRLDMGEVLEVLSHMPENVSLTSLNFDDGSFTLTGGVWATVADAQRILNPVITDLKNTSLNGVRISTIKEDPSNSNVSDFTITAYSGSGSNNESLHNKAGH